MEALKDYKDIKCLSAIPFIKCLMKKNLTTWDTIDYKRIVFAKLDAIQYTMDEYKDSPIGYIDTDIIVFKDPTPIMLEAMKQNPEHTVFSQCDESIENTPECTSRTKCPNLCSGVIVFKPALSSMFRYSEKDIMSFYTDQHFLCSLFNKLNVKYLTISKNIFLNGSHPGVRMDKKPLVIPKTAALLHYNYMIGSDKESNMRRNGMWYVGK